MELKTELSCPLGHKCQEVKGESIHQCAWFISIAGQNPNTGETVNEKGCAMSWLPILLVENARVSRSSSAALESLRNEVAKAPLLRVLEDPKLINP